jgi:hypothetical protein
MTSGFKKMIEAVLGADYINATQKTSSFSFPEPLITINKNSTKITSDLDKYKLSLVGFPLKNTTLKNFDTIHNLPSFRNLLIRTSEKISIENIFNKNPNPLFLMDHDLSFKEKTNTKPQAPPLIIVLQINTTTNSTKQASSSVKTEHNKLQTREKHKSWQKEYKKLKRKHPDLSNTEISRRIAKMPIAQDKTAGTIRRIMTK